MVLFLVFRNIDGPFLTKPCRVYFRRPLNNFCFEVYAQTPIKRSADIRVHRACSQLKITSRCFPIPVSTQSTQNFIAAMHVKKRDCTPDSRSSLIAVHCSSLCLNCPPPPMVSCAGGTSSLQSATKLNHTPSL